MFALINYFLNIIQAPFYKQPQIKTATRKDNQYTFDSCKSTPVDTPPINNNTNKLENDIPVTSNACSEEVKFLDNDVQRPCNGNVNTDIN